VQDTPAKHGELSTASRTTPTPPMWIARGDALDNQSSPGHAPIFTRAQSCSAFPRAKAKLLKGSERKDHPLANMSVMEGRKLHLQYEWRTYDPRTGMASAVYAPYFRYTIPGLCVAGGSHARNLAAQFSGSFFYRHRFVAENTEGSIDNISAASMDTRCRVFVAQWGQWDLGWPNGFAPWPLLERALDDRMRELRSLQDSKSVPVWLATCNYNGLNCIITKCKPSDWRSPPFVDEFNRLLRVSAERHGLPVISLDDIHGPLWDSSGDFCHPDMWVLRTMASRVGSTICAHQSAGCGPLSTKAMLPLLNHPSDAHNWTLSDTIDVHEKKKINHLQQTNQ
jgi:hypothetical protein